MAKKIKNIAESEMLTKLIAQGMSDKKASDIVVLDLRNVQGAPASYFVICTGNSHCILKLLPIMYTKL